jgi:hypothetical protein
LFDDVLLKRFTRKSLSNSGRHAGSGSNRSCAGICCCSRAIFLLTDNFLNSVLRLNSAVLFRSATLLGL